MPLGVLIFLSMVLLRFSSVLDFIWCWVYALYACLTGWVHWVIRVLGLDQWYFGNYIRVFLGANKKTCVTRLDLTAKKIVVSLWL